jgi:hypothetical protein
MRIETREDTPERRRRMFATRRKIFGRLLAQLSHEMGGFRNAETIQNVGDRWMAPPLRTETTTNTQTKNDP